MFLIFLCVFLYFFEWKLSLTTEGSAFIALGLYQEWDRHKGRYKRHEAALIHIFMLFKPKENVLKMSQESPKKVLRKSSKSPQKVLRKPLVNPQKVLRKSSESPQKALRMFSESHHKVLKKLSKNCQKVSIKDSE